MYNGLIVDKQDRFTRKKLSRNLLESLDSEGIAWWFMDDGSLCKGSCEEGYTGTNKVVELCLQLTGLKRKK